MLLSGSASLNLRVTESFIRAIMFREFSSPGSFRGKELFQMKLKKFMGIVSALILIVFSASGCSSANQADTETVNAAIDKFRACESFSLVQLSENQETVVFEGENYAYLAYSEMEMDLISGEDAQMRTSTRAVSRSLLAPKPTVRRPFPI